MRKYRKGWGEGPPFGMMRNQQTCRVVPRERGGEALGFPERVGAHAYASITRLGLRHVRGVKRRLLQLYNVGLDGVERAGGGHARGIYRKNAEARRAIGLSSELMSGVR